MAGYLFLADGFEEVEAVTVVDLLKRAQIDIKMVSITKNLLVKGSHGITIETDILFEKADMQEGDFIVLPGGMPGTKWLSEHKGLQSLIEFYNKSGKRIAAICAAPSVLGAMGLLTGKKAVSFPKFEDQLIGAHVLEYDVVTDGNITTSRGLGTAISFSLELIRLLKNSETAQQIKESILF